MDKQPTLQERIQLQLSGIPNIFQSIPPYYRRDIEAALLQALRDYAEDKRKDKRHIDDLSFLYYQERQPEKSCFERGYDVALHDILCDLPKTCSKCSANIPRYKDVQVDNFTLCPTCAQNLGAKCQKDVPYSSYLSASNQCGACKGPCSWSK
ncbi:MAG: hypothetical protein PHI29_13245 [Gallionella sp.]|nr:hypothetical protein [Gallionella sp.]